MTLATSPTAVDKFSAAYESFVAESVSSPKWVKDMRQQAWDTFAELGLPTKRRGNELWKYTNLRPLAAADFEFRVGGSVTRNQIKSSAPWDDVWNTLVVVDGKFNAELSNLHGTVGLNAGSLSEAISSGTGDVESQLASLAGHEEYAFTALSTAFVDDGAYIALDAGTELEAPVQVVFVTSDAALSRVNYPRLLVDSGAGSSIVLIETHVNLSESAQFSAPVVEMFAGDSSTIRHYRVQMENESSFHLGTTRIHQLGDTNFTSTTFAVGASIARNDIHTLLDAPGASCTLRGLYMTSGSQQQDQEISTTHAKPGCQSDQFYKGILSGKSHAVFSGKVIVMRDAQKSEASQKDLNLLLSRGVEIDAKPSLEIYADDVIAAHGATAGHVDRDTLFYLQSRGVDEEAAKAILVRGFAEEMLNEFKPQALNDFVERITDERIPVLLAESDSLGTT
jgi:Fe-S cluster assembly protein SufD